jgi:hypothetical protein
MSLLKIIEELPVPDKHWSYVGVSEETVVLNYNHVNYTDDNMSLHYDTLSDDAKTAFDDLKALDDSEFGVTDNELDSYEHKTELLALIAALEA